MVFPKGIKAVDTWINLNPAADAVKPGNTNPVEYLFNEAERVVSSPEKLVALMDEFGIEIGVLPITADNRDNVLKALGKYPGRFAGAVMLNPHLGMQELRRLESLVRDHGIKAAMVGAHRIQKPYNDKIYYPFYSKCIELDIPITANVGIPGPRVPGESLNPIYLDEVCWFFPELKVVMTHGGEPWQFLCVKLMLKWPNLYYMTSAFSPKYYPKEIIEYMNTRGADKVMFATAFPHIDFKKAVPEVGELPLRDHVWQKFLRENAVKVFKLNQS